jgi:hypothetical protein
MNMLDRLSGAAFKKFVRGAFLLLALMILPRASGAGVTIITHGYDGDVTGWITAMANVIPGYYQRRYPGSETNFSEYTMTVTYNSGSYFCTVTNDGSPPASTQSGEVIIKLDWSNMAGGTAPYDITTSNVAWAVTLLLLQTNLIPALNGHSVVELPIHLIGHSRGGSLISEISRDLGTNGVWVDEISSLDPHPLNTDGNNDSPVTVVDAPCHTYENVLYHDDWWQNMGSSVLDPNGEAVAGAYTRHLTDLNGGYSGIGGIFGDPYEYHSNVHLWYYGTINSNTPATYDDDGTQVTLNGLMRTNWWVPYEAKGADAGFFYSLIGGANRLSTDRPLGLPSDPAVVDGYNQYWDLGAGMNPNRTALPANNGIWPNVIKFDVTGTNTVTAGSVISSTLYYQYAGSSNLTLQIFYDHDLNPYNSNSVPIVTLQPPATGAGSVMEYSNLGLSTTNVAPGMYSIYAKISDGRHTRYLYAPELVQITSFLPPVLDITVSGHAKYIIGITGVAGQTNVLQSSSDLQNWTPLATNILTTSRWTYTNSTAASLQFYRAAVVP